MTIRQPLLQLIFKTNNFTTTFSSDLKYMILNDDSSENIKKVRYYLLIPQLYPVNQEIFLMNNLRLSLIKKIIFS